MAASCVGRSCCGGVISEVASVGLSNHYEKGAEIKTKFS